MITLVLGVRNTNARNASLLKKGLKLFIKNWKLFIEIVSRTHPQVLKNSLYESATASAEYLGKFVSLAHVFSANVNAECVWGNKIPQTHSKRAC